LGNLLLRVLLLQLGRLERRLPFQLLLLQTNELFDYKAFLDRFGAGDDVGDGAAGAGLGTRLRSRGAISSGGRWRGERDGNYLGAVCLLVGGGGFWAFPAKGVGVAFDAESEGKDDFGVHGVGDTSVEA